MARKLQRKPPKIPKRLRGQLLRAALVKQGVLGDVTNAFARVKPNNANRKFLRGGRRPPP